MRTLAFLLYAMNEWAAVSSGVHKLLVAVIFLTLSTLANFWSPSLEVYYLLGIFSCSYIFWGERHAEKFLSYLLHNKLREEPSLIVFEKSKRNDIACLLVPLFMFLLVVIPLFFSFLWTLEFRN